MHSANAYVMFMTEMAVVAKQTVSARFTSLLIRKGIRTGNV